MKSLAIFSIALASMAFANTNEPANASATRKPKESANPNHLSFGPDVFWQHFDEDKDNQSAESNGVFGGARLRYEYKKPDAFYAGTDGMFAAGRVKDEVEVTTPESKESEKRTAYAANVEQRLGYSIGVDGNRASLTPFVGAGWYYTKPVSDGSISNSFVYALAGFNSNCEVNDSFGLGLTGKALYSFYEKTHTEGASGWDKSAWGVEVDVPMTWHIDEAKTWDLTFEPYFQDLDVQNHFMNVGGRLLTSYNF